MKGLSLRCQKFLGLLVGLIPLLGWTRQGTQSPVNLESCVSSHQVRAAHSVNFIQQKSGNQINSKFKLPVAKH